MMSVADPVLSSTANVFNKRKNSIDDTEWGYDFQTVSFILSDGVNGVLICQRVFQNHQQIVSLPLLFV